MVYVYDRVRFPLHMVHTCVSIYTLLWSCVLQKWIIANAQFNVPERANEVLKWPLDTNVNNFVIPRKDVLRPRRTELVQKGKEF